jgi:hypothetical protein
MGCGTSNAVQPLQQPAKKDSDAYPQQSEGAGPSPLLYITLGSVPLPAPSTTFTRTPASSAGSVSQPPALLTGDFSSSTYSPTGPLGLVSPVHKFRSDRAASGSYDHLVRRGTERSSVGFGDTPLCCPSDNARCLRAPLTTPTGECAQKSGCDHAGLATARASGNQSFVWKGECAGSDPARSDSNDGVSSSRSSLLSKVNDDVDGDLSTAVHDQEFPSVCDERSTIHPFSAVGHDDWHDFSSPSSRLPSTRTSPRPGHGSTHHHHHHHLHALSTHNVARMAAERVIFEPLTFTRRMQNWLQAVVEMPCLDDAKL